MNRVNAVIAVQNTLVALAAYLAGLHFTGLFHAESAPLGAVWSVAAGIVVIQATSNETLKSAALRLLGTFLGAALGAAYLYMFSFSVVGMALSVGIAVFLCKLAAVPDNGRLAAITVVIILAISAAMPSLAPLTNAALRFGESCIGVGIAAVIVLLWPKTTSTAN